MGNYATLVALSDAKNNSCDEYSTVRMLTRVCSHSDFDRDL